MKYLIVLCFITNAVFAVSSRDFFVEKVVGVSRDKQHIPTDCRAQIRKAICLVDSDPDKMSCAQRPCLAGGEEYAVHFERLYDAYPKALKKMFCHLDNIFIEKQFFGTAYAGTQKNTAGKTERVCIGIRKSVLDDKLNLEQWASWKEQLSFGGETGGYKLTSGLPLVESFNRKPVNDFLYFVIAHEFGHQFDFANGYNLFKDPKCGLKEEECEMAPDSFGAITWKTDQTVKPQYQFPHQKELCFYTCNGKSIPASEQEKLYATMYWQTPFISTYSATEPWDDFADSMGYVVTRSQLRARYALYAGDHRYNIMRKLRSRIFRSKYNFVMRVLSNPNLKYPKDMP